mgnify:CR=1 FL=1
MDKMKRFIMIMSLIVLFPISSIDAKMNQHGSQYDDKIPLKPISYIFESENIDGKILSFQGTITALCKNDGCWFKLKDNTHEILVDLKPFDFRTHKKIVGKKVKINGKVNTKNGKTKIDAISVVEID